MIHWVLYYMLAGPGDESQKACRQISYALSKSRDRDDDYLSDFLVFGGHSDLLVNRGLVRD